MAARKVRWVAQAEDVIRRELPADFVDANVPDLATIKSKAIQIADRLARTKRTGDPIAFRDEPAPPCVQVIFVADRKQVTAYAIVVDYGAGWETPLDRYP